MNSVLFAFLLTLLAGLSTTIGAALGVLGKSASTKTLSIGLGFSAGVMIYVSLVEILPKGFDALSNEHGEVAGHWLGVAAFFGGIAAIGLIDRFVPDSVNPHEPASIDPDRHKHALMRTGVLTAGALALHNFPEGFATFIAALQEPQVGIAVAVAIAIHNIPEGLAVAVPIYQATGSRRKGFLLAALSGLAEPAGALLGYFILMPFLSDTLFGIVFAAIAGVMVFISLDELLPAAHEFGEHHLTIYGLIAGMAVMAVSLLLFL
ncbi:zinc transporter ZupT [Gulosibacter molinativorax]|uniref:Zinc transporter ZupT n=1 Tax=Gulosibacter molinativorax TaxID=256821 RepID=A0ABT7CAV5_9MICO|nr:zinc transporter ZupT [Gulosibacter molinativorax]MDJ1372333.1 zinc transporter ZupT [Gulosibacter molinativorax]QUY63427.1 Zinc transporter ZupT [Gulosibacter molinativorax]